MDANTTGTNLASDEEALTGNLDETNNDLLERSRELLAAETRLPEITDDETSGKASDYVALIRKAIKVAESAREAAKSPFLLAGRRVDAYFQRKLTDPLGALRDRVLKAQTAYLRKKEEAERAERQRLADIARREAQAREAEAQRLAEKAKTERGLEKAIVAEAAAEAAKLEEHETAQAAGVKAAEISRVRGDYSTTSLATFWDFRGLDVSTVDLETLRPYLHQAAIETAVRLFIRRGGRELVGCEIFENKKAR